MRDRTDIKNFVVYIEQNFQVNDWKINGICVWPMLRILLYSYLKDKISKENFQPPKTAIKPKLRNIFLKKLLRLLYSPLDFIRYYFWLNKLRRKKYLFAAHAVHTDKIGENRINRFFTPLIEYFRLGNKFNYLEYNEPSPIPLKYSEEDILYHAGLQFYMNSRKLLVKLGLHKKPKLELEGYKEFISFLKMNGFSRKFGEEYSILPVHFVQNFSLRLQLYQDILDRINPDFIFVACYYSFGVFPLMAVANRKKIPIYEMQHGPQNATHLAYGSWSNVPSGGYDLLPRTFWTWDEESSKLVNTWKSKVSKVNYCSLLGGNPWLIYWNSKKMKFTDYVLYSLQPFNKIGYSFKESIQLLFPPSLLNVIRKSDKMWFIRLHPRQREDFKAITSFLKKNNVLNKINISDATNLPLPLVIKGCCLHVTNFSGTSIEAAMMNKHTILLNETGNLFFPTLIDEGKATFLKPNIDNFEILFNDVLFAEETDLQTELKLSYSVKVMELFKD